MIRANGVITQPYVRGVVQCAGNPVYGFSCVSPILDLTNSTDKPLVVSYSSRARDLSLDEANRITLEPNGGRALLTGMLPSAETRSGSRLVSFVAISSGQLFDVYSLVFGSGSGYQLVPAAGHFEASTGGIVSVSDTPSTCVTPTVGVFPLQYCGCAAPNWPWNLVYTASIGRQGQCYNRGAVAPCESLASWVTSSS